MPLSVYIFELVIEALFEDSEPHPEQSRDSLDYSILRICYRYSPFPPFHLPFAKLSRKISLPPFVMNGRGPAEVPCRRSYFYVGGHYADDGTGTGQHVMKEQMFVEQLEPSSGSMRPHPLVFLHGNAQTGSVSPQSPTYYTPVTHNS